MNKKQRETIQKVWTKYLNARAESDKLRAESYKLYAESYKLYAESDKLHAEGDKLHAEGRIALMEIIINILGKQTPITWDYPNIIIDGEVFDGLTAREGKEK